MSAAFPKQAMRRGKLGNIHVLIKMRALLWKKSESIDIVTAAHRLIHEMMDMRGTAGSRVFCGDKVIHLMHVRLKETAWVMQLFLLCLMEKEILNPAGEFTGLLCSLDLLYSSAEFRLGDISIGNNYST